MRKLLLPILLTGASILVTLNPAMAQQKKWTTVRIVTEGGFVPWNFTKPDGSLGGFEIDLAKNLCDRMGVKCTISAQSFDSMIPALQAGKYDAIIDDLVITPKREETIAFSSPYAALCNTLGTMKGSSVATQIPANDKIISLSDQAATSAALEPIRRALKGKIVGTLSAGTSVQFFDTYLHGAAAVRQYKTPEARDLDLLAGRVDAIVGSKDALIGAAATHGSTNIVLAGPCFQGGVMGTGSGVGLRKGDPELKAMFDEAIHAAQADGTIKRLSEATFHMDVTPR